MWAVELCFNKILQFLTSSAIYNTSTCVIVAIKWFYCIVCTIFPSPESLLCTDSGKLLPGVEIGITTMRVKEKSRFLIRPRYAFGEKGCPPRIPENATCELTNQATFVMVIMVFSTFLLHVDINAFSAVY